MDRSGSDIRAEEALAQTPLFGGLAPSALRELADRCVRRRTTDGSYLFHAKDPADRLFVLADGQFEVVRRQPDSGAEIILNTLGPGTVVGELAIVRGEKRSASVRSRGPGLVFELDALTFVHYARRWPDLSWSLARSVAEEFVTSERRRHETGAPVWVIAMSKALAPDLPVEIARAALPYLKARSTSNRVHVLAPLAATSFEEAGFRVEVTPLVFPKPSEVADLVRAERPRSALVVVGASEVAVADALPLATGFVAALDRAQAPLLPSLAEGAKRLTVGPGGAASASHVRSGPGAAGRIARLLLGTSVGLALSGGAARGLAQLGVLAALEALKVPVDFLVGTSVGALVGGLTLARGLPAVLELAGKLRSSRHVIRAFFDPSFHKTRVLDGTRLRAFLEHHLGDTRIEDLPIPFGAVALDLEHGDEVTLTQGRLADALRASGALPGLIAPYRYQPPGAAAARELVDGSTVNLVPIDAARALGAHRVIGVHIARMRELAPPPASGGSELSTLAMSLVHAHLLGLARLGERQVFGADVAILPDAGAFGFADFWRGAELIELGREATLHAAAELRLLTGGQ
jgi:predicted acylesterase/phospholipase RssA/CRP-like cAMP-binding protein